MTLLLAIILTASAGELKLLYYSVYEEVQPGKQWLIHGDKGYYLCTAETVCSDMHKGAQIISGRELWYDPILLFFYKESQRERCMMESCVRPKVLTYDDL